MQAFFFLLLGLLCLAALAHGLSFYPIRLRLKRENNEFSAVLSYLFYNVTLTDTEHPIDPRDFTDRNWQKRKQRALEIKQKKRYRFRRGEHPLPRRKRTRGFFYLRFTTRLLRVLNAENVKRLSISVRRFSYFYSTGDPAYDALLYAGLTNGFSLSLEALSRIARVRVRQGRILFCSDFPHLSSDLSFYVVLSMPLWDYLSIFHAFVPTSERVLRVLAKRKEIIEKQ